METASLRQLLKSLCSGSDWDYAVFWKLKHQNPKFLLWEDGFVNHPKPRMLMDNFSYMPNFNGTSNTYPFDDESSLIYGCPNQYQTGHVVADMAFLQYAMGEGLVGKAACTGNDYWISSQDTSTIHFNYNEPFEFPAEWIPQFMVGYKTVVLVPVLPHGVLQLGSFEVIAEDTTISDHIKERYYAHRIVSGISPSSSSEQDTSWNASLACIASFMDEIDDHSAITCSPVDILPSVESDDCNLTTDPAISLQKILEDAMEDKDQAPLLGCYSEALIPINEEDDGEQTGFEKLSNFLSFPLHCELFKATGFQGDEYFSNGDLQDVTGNSRDFLDSMEPSTWDFAKFPCVGEAEECLETIVSFTSVFSTLSDTDQQNGVPARSASLKSVVTTLNDREQKNGEPTISASLRSAVSTLEETGKEKGCSSAQAKEEKKKPSGRKRKARPDDSQKQRPRDRQLIQDRVKELRELVPNGSKCSIDALLDLTIKHMGFLRGVTDQAEKLRKCTPTKKSVPFHSGNEFDMYPIVVEDLENPVGHLLIEMLCEEEGLFLEIAQVIKRLDLTIVKGVMERRADSTCWASFIVEASKGFQRTDIFWPLTQVLQRQRSSVPSAV